LPIQPFAHEKRQKRLKWLKSKKTVSDTPG
jgi:hypothetical protein